MIEFFFFKLVFYFWEEGFSSILKYYVLTFEEHFKVYVQDKNILKYFKILFVFEKKS